MTKGDSQENSRFQLVDVAVPAPLFTTFSYEYGELPKPGTRVVVPFGPRKVVGVALGAALAQETSSKFKIKKIISTVDDEPAYSEILIRLARWMSQYYQHPLGEVLKSMLPGGSAKVVDRKIVLTDAGLSERGQQPDSDLANIFGNRSELTLLTINKKAKKLGLSNDIVSHFKKSGLVTVASSSRMRAREFSKDTSTDPGSNVEADRSIEYTEEQAAAIEKIVESEAEGAARKPILLWGVTGAGKTEVYMAAISRLLSDATGSGNGQVLVLVPEISLTPQMTEVFESRFPGQVAVVHSALTDRQRWGELERIRSGAARILIGPRSAVFAPFHSLKLVVVDEEHDSSYKQGSGLFYHGRDVAVVRGKWENAVTILGSATPSLESFQNAKDNKYQLIKLAKRATGASLPSVELIEVSAGHRHGLKVASGGRLLPLNGIDAKEESGISRPLLEALKENHRNGHQAMVLVNRRGFAYYLFSVERKKSLECPNCSISLTFHKFKSDLRCHYCDYSKSLAKIAEERPTETLVAIGHGSQKVETFLEEQIPGLRVARLDSDTVSDREVLPQVLSDFRKGDIDVLVGTQMLAKGHDFPKVTLIAIVEVDQVINMPDFRAGERAFQLIVQAAGRAGRAELPGHVMIQTSKADHPIIKFAVEQDFDSFAERELCLRRDFRYPPFSRLVAVEISSTDRVSCARWADRLEAGLEQFRKLRGADIEGVRILGPSVPPVEILRNRFRRSFLFSGTNVKGLQLLAQFVQQVGSSSKANIRIKVDIDPQSLM